MALAGLYLSPSCAVLWAGGCWELLVSRSAWCTEALGGLQRCCEVWGSSSLSCFSCLVGVACSSTEPSWKCICTLSGYHTRTIYDVAW